MSGRKEPATHFDVSRFLTLLWHDGDIREVRVPRHDRFGRTASGYFDSPDKLARAVAQWDRRANVYVTANPVRPALLARASNRIEVNAKNTTSDQDIVKRCWLPIDIDPVRPPGISSNEAELAAAKATLVAVASFLGGHGWPEPIRVMSGNGCYALYSVELPNDDQGRGLVEGILKALAARFDTDAVHIDPTVFNASRMVPVIGTFKMKGDSIPERPHRYSSLLVVPDTPSVVPVACLSTVAAMDKACKKQPGNAGPATGTWAASLEDILRSHGIESRKRSPDAEGFTWYHVRQCPFHDDGNPFECGVGQKLPDGPYAGHCFHPEGQGQGWQEWKEALGLSVGFTGRATPSTNADAARPGEDERLTDTWNAHRLVKTAAGDLLWCEVYRLWFVYDGTRYARDLTREVERRAEKAVKKLYEYAGTLSTNEERRRMAEWAVTSEGRYRLTNMIESAKRMVPVRPAEFDQDPLLLNLLNGTVDLRTGRLREHRRSDRLTKRADVEYQPSAACPQWLAFLQRIFQGNAAIISFTQRLFGYCLTGLLTEHIVVILYGTGANGKSTLLGILRFLAGDYAYHCRPEVFTSKRNDSQGFELVNLAGARVVTASETGSGRRLDEALVKEMTGGEPINCAPKYGNFFSFRPSFKPLLATNHKPEVRGADEGLWRRVILLPFAVTIPEPERDRDLPAKLQEELPGILNWALEGLREFLATGLKPPAEVRTATADYRAEQDILAGWIEDRCLLESGVSDEYAALYQDYVSWCEANKEEPVKKSRFSSSLDERGCPTHRGTKGRRTRLGIARRSREVTR